MRCDYITYGLCHVFVINRPCHHPSPRSLRRRHHLNNRHPRNHHCHWCLHP